MSSGRISNDEYDKYINLKSSKEKEDFAKSILLSKFSIVTPWSRKDNAFVSTSYIDKQGSKRTGSSVITKNLFDKYGKRVEICTSPKGMINIDLGKLDIIFFDELEK